uniref:Serine/threonine-protein kinase SMG1 n=1 Tax=Lygus hesperus TaxID=30085 RepID=A0A0A9WN93_LYGHE
MLGRLTKELMLHQVVEEIRGEGSGSSHNTTQSGHPAQQSGHSAPTPRTNRASVVKYVVRYETLVDIIRYKNAKILEKLESQEEGAMYECGNGTCTQQHHLLTLSDAVIAIKTYRINYSRGLISQECPPPDAAHTSLFCTTCFHPLVLRQHSIDKIELKRRFNELVHDMSILVDHIFRIIQDKETLHHHLLASGGEAAATGGGEVSLSKAAPGGRVGFSSTIELESRKVVPKFDIEWDSVHGGTYAPAAAAHDTNIPNSPSNEIFNDTAALGHSSPVVPAHLSWTDGGLYNSTADVTSIHTALQQRQRLLDRHEEKELEERQWKSIIRSLFGDSNASEPPAKHARTAAVSPLLSRYVDSATAMAASLLNPTDSTTSSSTVKSEPVKSESVALESAGSVADGVDTNTHVSVRGQLVEISQLTEELLQQMTDPEYEHYTQVASMLAVQATHGDGETAYR